MEPSEEPVVAAVDESVIVVVGIDDLIVTLWVPPELDVTVAIFVKFGPSISTITIFGVGSLFGIFSNSLVVNLDLVKPLIWLVLVGGNYTLSVWTFVPEFLVSVDLIP